MSSLTRETQEEIRIAQQRAAQEVLDAKAREEERQQLVQRRLSIVDFGQAFLKFTGDVARYPRRLLEDLLGIDGAGVQRIRLAPNRNMESLGGHVIEYDPTTRGIKAATIISAKRALGVTAVFKVARSPTESTVRLNTTYGSVLPTILSELPRDAPDFSLIMPGVESRDVGRWSAYLPVGSRVGLYIKEGSIYLFIITSIGGNVNAYIDSLLAEESMTIGQFAEDPRFLRLEKLVARNVRRVAAFVIRRLGFPDVPVHDDTYTRRSDDLSYYELASPLFYVKHNHVQIDARGKKIRISIDVASSSAIISPDDEYPVYCGRTVNYFMMSIQAIDDSRLLPLKTDKLVESDRSQASEEEIDSVTARISYLTPRAEHVGTMIKYRRGETEGGAVFRHITSVHV